MVTMMPEQISVSTCIKLYFLCTDSLKGLSHELLLMRHAPY